MNDDGGVNVTDMTELIECKNNGGPVNLCDIDDDGDVDDDGVSIVRNYIDIGFGPICGDTYVLR